MKFSRKVFALPFGLAAALMCMAASPAAAQTEAAAVQISGKVEQAAQRIDSPLGKGDEEFSALFSSWKSLDNGTGIPSAVRASVSVPEGMPVDFVKMTSGFGMRSHPILKRRAQHKGIDLAAPIGTPVYATADGVVAKAEWFGGYGNYIQIEHGGELETRYGHLSAYNVAAGDRVHKGDLIGYVGTTGRSTGPHLHYEVRVAGQAVDPTPYLTDTNGIVELVASDSDDEGDLEAVGGGD